MKRALIIGLNSEEGFYLVRFLLSRNFDIMILGNISHKIYLDFYESVNQFMKNEKVKLHLNTLTKFSDVTRTITLYEPEEIYNLIEDHYPTGCNRVNEDVYYITTLEILKMLQCLKLSDKIKVYQASNLSLHRIIMG